jgi:hypothetical protein
VVFAIYNGLVIETKNGEGAIDPHINYNNHLYTAYGSEG